MPDDTPGGHEWSVRRGPFIVDCLTPLDLAADEFSAKIVSKEPNLTDFNKALDKFQKAKPNAWLKNLPVNNEVIHLLKPAQGVVVVDKCNDDIAVRASIKLLEGTTLDQRY